MRSDGPAHCARKLDDNAGKYSPSSWSADSFEPYRRVGIQNPAIILTICLSLVGGKDLIVRFSDQILL